MILLLLSKVELQTMWYNVLTLFLLGPYIYISFQSCFRAKYTKFDKISFGGCYIGDVYYLYFLSFDAENCVSNSSFEWGKCEPNNSAGQGLKFYNYSAQGFETYRHIVASELKDPIWHSLEWQIGFFSSEATTCIFIKSMIFILLIS